jgi:hypothetical protein
VTGRSAATTSGPMVMLGTKRPSCRQRVRSHQRPEHLQCMHYLRHPQHSRQPASCNDESSHHDIDVNPIAAGLLNCLDLRGKELGRLTPAL